MIFKFKQKVEKLSRQMWVGDREKEVQRPWEREREKSTLEKLKL